MPDFLSDLMAWLPSATVLWFVVASNATYLAVMWFAAVRDDDTDDAFTATAHIIAAFTTAVWLPFAVLVAIARAVMGPLRLSVEWGAVHLDNNDRPSKRRGRWMRRVVSWFPWLTVGTFSFYKWHLPSDRSGTQTNRILEVGFRRFGLSLIRIGEVVGDVDQKPGPRADPDVEHEYVPPAAEPAWTA